MGIEISTPLVYMLIFGVIITIFASLMFGNIETIALSIDDPPDLEESPACNIVTFCLNIVGAWIASFFSQTAYYLGIVIQVIGLIGSTMLMIGSSSFIPFPFNMILISVIGIPAVILIIQIVRGLFP